jgi:DNA-3-methyladenine glycosylase I
MTEMMENRCSWAKKPLLRTYHDSEWGVPLYDDTQWYEFLILDAFQAGLTWELILTRRPHFRRVFAEFNPAIVATYDAQMVETLMQDAGIIRNRLKIEASIKNARAFLKVQNDYGSFSRYAWQFVNGAPIVNHWKESSDIPAVSDEAVVMSKDLKQKGFSFVGPTICYAIMQSAGMVNDHVVGCFRHAEIVASYGH